MMKNRSFIKLAIVITALMGIATLWSCDKRDSASSFGFGYLYIPQSTVSGGVNLDYLVPSGLDTNTYNYKIDMVNKKVNVYLGVLRSGDVGNNAYSVNISTNPDTVNTMIANGTINVSPDPTFKVFLLPSSAYSLPSTVSVASGQSAGNFYLSIDEPTLKTYAGQKVALCVTLSNPTGYKLSPTNSKVIIIIDVNQLKLP